MAVELGFIVEGHCEYESIPSIVAKIHGYFNYPIVNAKGIGNVIKNTGDELLYLVKHFAPRKVIITLDYREAEREGLVNNCTELKEMVLQNCNAFMQTQQSGSLTLPEEIVVVIADKTYESWICADYENLKNNDLFDSDKDIYITSDLRHYPQVREFINTYPALASLINNQNMIVS